MKSFGPYSPIRQTGCTFYISGQVGVDPKTGLAKKDIQSQTRQVMENIKSVLGSRTLKCSDLVKTTIYLKNIADFSKVNSIYENYFEKDQPKPARSCVEVSNLPKLFDQELLIEIEAVAYKE